jgi:hypothetical protein
VGFFGRIGWLTSYHGSVLLLAGGLFILGVLFLMLLVQSTVFGHPPAEAAARRAVLVAPPAVPEPLSPERAEAILAEKVEPESARRLAALAAQHLGPPSLDRALDAFVASGLGDPRIAETGGRRKVLRVAETRTASCYRVLGERAPAPACAYECGFLSGAFSGIARRPVHVAERACRACGDRACEFEVTY